MAYWRRPVRQTCDAVPELVLEGEVGKINIWVVDVTETRTGSVFQLKDRDSGKKFYISLYDFLASR